MLNLNFKILHMGDKNLMTDANRRTDKEKKTYKDFSSSLGDLAGVGCCALYSRALVYIFIN